MASSLARNMSAEVEEPPTPAGGLATSLQETMACVLESLDTNGDGRVRRRDVTKLLESHGLVSTDRRLRAMYADLEDEEAYVSIEKLSAALVKGGNIVLRAFQGSLIIPDFAAFRRDCQSIFDEVRSNKGGQPAQYIPALAKQNPDLFAMACVTVDGQSFTLGDIKASFCLQSTSKPVTYLCSLDENGIEKTHQHVGTEPSGVSFNSMVLKEVTDPRNPAKAIPHNPLINAGALMTSSLIRRQDTLADRLAYYMDKWSALCESRVGFDAEVYLSEKTTADRNFALSYMMRESNAFPPGVDIVENLDFYFQTCSLTVNTVQLATAAANLANGGSSPYTGRPVFSSAHVRAALSCMATSGLYDSSGEFFFRIGVPAKSGVSGAIFLVIPNVMGIAVFSPPLDKVGNSVRGVDFATRLLDRFAFHQFDSLRGCGAGGKINPCAKRQLQTGKETVFELLTAAASGNLTDLQLLLARGVDLSAADYDRRTALHLAASEGHLKCANFLIAHAPSSVNSLDRWGRTPLDDAREGGYSEIAARIEAAGGKGGEEVLEKAQLLVIPGSGASASSSPDTGVAGPAARAPSPRRRQVGVEDNVVVPVPTPTRGPGANGKGAGPGRKPGAGHGAAGSGTHRETV